MTHLGFFAGSFDPPTLGHVDLVRRALSVVDELIVGVGRNADKRGWISFEDRLELLRGALPSEVRVLAYDGLTVRAAETAGATVLVRGLRGPEDLPSELHMSRANTRLASTLESVFLVATAEVAHISSRLVREVHRSGGPVDAFVPPNVAAHLSQMGGSSG